MTRRRLSIDIIALCLFGFAGAACNVVESHRIDLETPPTSYADGPPCASALGSYALPKSFVRLRIGQKAGAAPDIAVAADGDPPVAVVKHPDPRLLFCLDHLNSATSDDKISIVKWPSDKKDVPHGSFLGAVLVNVTDQSAYIIKALIRAAFIAVSGDPGFAPRSATFAPAEIVGDFEFDPFDQREIATINAQLARLGFCVMLEDTTFSSVKNVQSYCNSPMAHSVRQTIFYKAYRKLQEQPADPFIPGILYRVPQPYRLLIFHRRDIQETWELQRTTTVQLENLAPVLSLRITRAAFANKTMHFVFSQGALQTACVSKTSEIAGFVEIPLEIARSLVEVPGAIVKVRIGDLQSEKELVQAQQRLYQMQQSYLSAVVGGTPTVPNPSPSPTVPNLADLSVPQGIKPIPTTAAWGSDLFNKALSTVCGGDST